jgi:hypothetical protein
MRTTGRAYYDDYAITELQAIDWKRFFVAIDVASGDYDRLHAPAHA